MADEGAFGEVYLVKQSEKHFGPHADWFWDVDQSGGGVLMDMGCHGIAFCHWFLDRPDAQDASPRRWAPTSIGDKTTGRGQLHRASSSSRTARSGWSRTSWARRAAWTTASRSSASKGVHLRQPAHGQRAADLQRESATATPSRRRRRRRAGPTRSSRSCGTTASRRRWTHFARCVRGKEHAAARPARTAASCRRCCLPATSRWAPAGAWRCRSTPYGVKKPIDLWFNPKR